MVTRAVSSLRKQLCLALMARVHGPRPLPPAWRDTRIKQKRTTSNKHADAHVTACKCKNCKLQLQLQLKLKKVKRQKQTQPHTDKYKYDANVHVHVHVCVKEQMTSYTNACGWMVEWMNKMNQDSERTKRGLDEKTSDWMNE